MRKRRQGSAKMGVFKRFIISHLTVAVVMLLAVIPTGNMLINSVYDQQISEAYAAAQESVGRISNEFESATTLTTLMSRDKTVQAIALLKDVPHSYYYHAASVKQLLTMSTLNWSLLSDCYVMFTANEVVFSAERIWFSHDSFYGDWLKYEDVSFEQWKADIGIRITSGRRSYQDSDAAYSFFRSDKLRRVEGALTCYIPFFKTASSSSGMLMFLISKDALISALNIGDDDFLLVCSPEGEEYVSLRAPEGLDHAGQDNIFEVRADGVDYAVFNIYDQSSGLNFIIGRDKSHTQGAISGVYGLLIGYVMVVTVIGLGLSCAMAYKEYRPVKELNRTVSELSLSSERGSGNEYDYLTDSFLSMHQDRLGFMNRIDDYMKEHKRQSFEAVLNKRYVGKGELDALMETTRLPEFYRVVISRIVMERGDAPDTASVEEGIANACLVDTISGTWQEGVTIHQLTEGMQLFVIPDEGAREKLNDLLNGTLHLMSHMSNVGRPEIFFAVSDVYGSPADLNQAYNEARGILTYRHNIGESIVFINDIDEVSKAYTLGSNSSNRLREYINAGDEDNALRIIDDIFRTQYLGDGDFNQIYYDVRSALIHAKSGIGGGDVEIPHLAPSQSRESQINELKDCCRDLCARHRQKKRSHNERLKHEIIKYIKDNYTNPEVYGKSIAAHFGINEKYLYTFFKEQEGTSIASYLEELRIAHSEMLLINSKHSVQDIAGMVGFNSPNTFYKAFTRVNGISPSEFRNTKR